MADAKFSFQERGRCYSPQWMAPEALQKKGKEINVKSADMWSFAVLLWELATRQVPFAELSPMEAGLKVNRLSNLTIISIRFTFSLDCADCAGGIEGVDSARIESSHGQIDSHLHERGSRQETHFRHGHSHPGEDETAVNGNRWRTQTFLLITSF